MTDTTDHPPIDGKPRDCEQCGKPAFVGFQGEYLCMECYGAAMAEFTERSRRVREELWLGDTDD